MLSRDSVTGFNDWFLRTVDHFRYNEVLTIERAPIEALPFSAAMAAMGLGFSLSLLIFMDQNIAEAMVNNPCNK